MTIIIDGTGTISGVSATGLTTAQTVGYSSLPAGSVLQVVNATYSTSTSNSTNVYADTGLTATITPKFATSKIIVLVNQSSVSRGTGNNSSQVKLNIVRNSTEIAIILNGWSYTGSSAYYPSTSASACYLDSPATTSATTYKTQFNNPANAAQVTVQEAGGTSTITLLEIAQ